VLCFVLKRDLEIRSDQGVGLFHLNFVRLAYACRSNCGGFSQLPDTVHSWPHCCVPQRRIASPLNTLLPSTVGTVFGAQAWGSTSLAFWWLQTSYGMSYPQLQTTFEFCENLLGFRRLISRLNFSKSWWYIRTAQFDSLCSGPWRKIAPPTDYWFSPSCKIIPLATHQHSS